MFSLSTGYLTIVVLLWQHACDATYGPFLTGVTQIYHLRPPPGKGGTLRRGSMLHCKTIAPKYGVTPKTIRDVWSGRSWAEATRHLWTDEESKRRSANEEDGKHSLVRSGMAPHGMHPDDPSRMAVSHPYMPGMVSMSTTVISEEGPHGVRACLLSPAAAAVK